MQCITDCFLLICIWPCALLPMCKCIVLYISLSVGVCVGIVVVLPAAGETSL